MFPFYSTLIGDHGARIGPLRNTMQGSLEERLPWASIVMPAWFEKQYPSLASNLRHNQDYVTSPFDLHATMQHLLSYPKLPQDVKTQSLFTKIGINRTCPQAGNDLELCRSRKYTYAPITEEVLVGKYLPHPTSPQEFSV